MTKNAQRNIVGYTRAFSYTQNSIRTQFTLIQSYCKSHNLQLDHIYSDIAPFRPYTKAAYEKISYLHLPVTQWSTCFPEWTKLLFRICNNEIDTIIVDTELRLYNSTKQRHWFKELCAEHAVTIIEVNNNKLPPDSSPSVVVYHFANHPFKRPRVVLSDIDSLYNFASRLPQSRDTAIFLELELAGKTVLNLIKENSKISTIVVKSLFHINRKIHPVIELAKTHPFLNIVSLEEGLFRLCSSPENPLLTASLRVLIYQRYLSKHEADNASLQMDIYKAFVRLKTNWHIVGTYLDETFGPKQGNWLPITHISDSYDVVLVESFQKFDTNIHSLKHILQQLNKPIYSMKEGEITLERH